MEILVTGGTGFLGGAVLTALQERGHGLRVASRRPDATRARLPAGIATHGWLPQGGGLDPAALAGVDAVIHLAGEPVAGRWTAAKRDAIRRSRVEGTRALVDALAQAPEPPRVLLSASAIGLYGDRGDEVLDEDASPGADFLALVCRDWEAEARRAEQQGLRVAHLRFGLVLGAGGGALAALLPLFRWGLGGPLGGGGQWWSWIHQADAVGLLLHALEEGVAGPINAVAPTPVRQRDFARALGRRLGRPSLLPSPAFALRAALGGFEHELLASRRVVPRQAEARGYAFRFAALEDALADLF